ncbi:MULTISPECIES: 23S rRNA (adenine(2503)-C(2))-methyltransferase RlmN [unclassified Helicobacter]|uniref:23S rRNA (adenine(2503)-C(2))-methyltransferase RlmN n=1 Tax=unclassified Helicobacter TaxID=2593540 RepID=UPI000CF0337A|nr:MULTISPECIES: 23S rRNA (adenine(2503)-C(2))-methyltransferase RlmN [unclassified Helicobacter]
MENIYNYTLEELESMIKPSFRAKQIYHWIYIKYVQDFDLMHNLPKQLKTDLKQEYKIKHLEPIKVEISQDGTKKYLFKTLDGHTFESVFIKMRDKKLDSQGNIIEGEKYTFCLSSQIGCKVGCAFCFTAKGGFIRDLSAGEIVEQVVWLKKDNNLLPEKRVNIVYMGMGEPLNNLDNVSKAIRILSELNGLSISARRQTISTSGIAPKIKKLGEMNLGVQLAISLHAVDNALRTRLIPMNKAYNIQSIIEAVKNFPVDTRKRVMFEYLVIKDVNDDLQSAKVLLKLLDGIKAKVNLILFNPHEGSEFKRPDMEQVKKFADFLIQRGLLATIRESKGIDISAACGQLREKTLQNVPRETKE